MPSRRAINQSADPLLARFRFRSIGPASMGGRIDDIAVSESNPNIIYIGYAVGGVFRSVNNGTTFAPVFETYYDGVDRRHRDPPAQSEHRLRRHRRAEQPPDVVVRRRHLQDDRRRQDLHAHRPEGTQTIARIVIDPKSPETVYVAVAGPPVRSESRSRRLQDDRRRKDLEQDQVHRRGHRVHRHRDRPVEPQHRSTPPATSAGAAAAASTAAVRAAASGRARRGEDVDEADRQRPAARHVRPHRARRLAVESERRVRADRGGGGRHAGADAARSSPAPATEATPPGPRPSRRPDERGRGAARGAQPARAAARVRRADVARFDWCNNGGPDRGFRRRGRGGAAPSSRQRAAHAAGAQSGRGGLFRSNKRPHVDAREQLRRPADVFQPAPRRSDQRPDDLRRRPARGEVARRRQDLRDPRRGRRLRRARRTSTSTRSGSTRRTRSTS